MAANAGRYPVSAQCEILGVARSTCCSMRSRAESPKPPDLIEPDALAAHEASRGRYGARKIKASLARRGVAASRRRICRIMRESGLASAYGRKKPECHPGRSNEADPPNAAAGQFGGRELRAKLADYVHWCNNFRIHSTLGYMTPVEFRKAGMILPESSK